MDNLQGTKFYVNRNLLSLQSFAARFKNVYLKSKEIRNDQGLIQSDPTSCPQNHKGTTKYINSKSDFIHIFVISYIAPGQGLTTPWGQNFDVNRNILSLWSFVTSFKIISLKFDFIHFYLLFFFFYDFIHVYSLGAGTRGQSSDVNRNISSLYSFVASLKKIFKV